MQSLTGKAIAMDGKTLRGSGDGEESPKHLLSAVVHKEGIVIAQKDVDERTNEITRVKPLFKGLDIEGSVVTGDALLTQREIARHILEEKKADYLFTVNGTKQELLEDIRAFELKKKRQRTEQVVFKKHRKCHSTCFFVCIGLYFSILTPVCAKIFSADIRRIQFLLSLIATLTESFQKA